MTVAWNPRYAITPAIANALMQIAGASAAVEGVAWSPLVEEEIRRRARLRSTHFSTRIEGNRLTLAEAEQVVAGKQVRFAGRERDVREVDNYWHALLQVEVWGRERAPVTEALVRRLHALVEKGPRRAPTPWRDGQNAVRESGSGRIVYLPPEAKDVPALMAALVRWIGDAEREGIPVPIIAGLAHYQFVTIHPFWDGNGRTARLLATLVLHRGGLGLRGFFSLEEYHARDIETYYEQLATHPHHNYYEGREDVDLTPWLEYFTGAVARVFTVARDEALRSPERGVPDEPELIRRLDARPPGARPLRPAGDDHRGRCARSAPSVRAPHARALSRVGRIGVPGAHRSVEPRPAVCVIGGLSAVHRRFIGTDGRRDAH